MRSTNQWSRFIIDRYFNLATESCQPSSDTNEENLAEELEHLENEDDGDIRAARAGEPGAVLSVLKDNAEDHLSDSNFGNCTDGDDDIEQNKENELQTCEELNSSQTASAKRREVSKRKLEEAGANHDRNSLHRPSVSPEKTQKQGVLTSHSLNINDSRTCASTDRSRETGLGELFGYRRSLKTRKLDDQSSQRKSDAAADVPVQPVEVIDIDSGYLSDTEMSTDGDTPSCTPKPSDIVRLTPLSSGGNVPLRQGSAVGTKVCCPCFCFVQFLENISWKMNRNYLIISTSS